MQLQIYEIGALLPREVDFSTTYGQNMFELWFLDARMRSIFICLWWRGTFRFRSVFLGVKFRARQKDYALCFTTVTKDRFIVLHCKERNFWEQLYCSIAPTWNLVTLAQTPSRAQCMRFLSRFGWQYYWRRETGNHTPLKTPTWRVNNSTRQFNVSNIYSFALWLPERFPVITLQRNEINVSSLIERNFDVERTFMDSMFPSDTRLSERRYDVSFSHEHEVSNSNKSSLYRFCWYCRCCVRLN